MFAVADNISDSLGIHVFQESDFKEPKAIRVSTFSNFLTRLLVTIVFILLVAFLPIGYAVISSIVWGISLLAVLSYFIAKQQRNNPYKAIFQHVAIAVAVIIVSNFLGEWITKIFSKY